MLKRHFKMTFRRNFRHLIFEERIWPMKGNLRDPFLANVKTSIPEHVFQ